MKLIELEPRWIASRWDVLDGIKFGITFDCPHCRKTRLGIYFKNPLGDVTKLDAALWADPRKGKKQWQRTNDTFETITISPSINAEESGHWHGFITDGEIR